MNSRRVGACKARAPAQGKKGLIDIRKLVGIEECEAHIGESTGVRGDIGRLQVGHELGIGVQLLVEGKLLAGVLFHGIAADFERWLLSRRLFAAKQGFDVAPMSEAALRFSGIRWTGEREREDPCNGFFISARFLHSAMGESESAGLRALTIEQAEDLRRDGGGLAALAREVRRGRIEDLQHRVGEAAQFQGVE